MLDAKSWSPPLSYKGGAMDRRGEWKAEEEARDQNSHSSAAHPRGGQWGEAEGGGGDVLTGRKLFQPPGGGGRGWKGRKGRRLEKKKTDGGRRWKTERKSHTWCFDTWLQQQKRRKLIFFY